MEQQNRLLFEAQFKRNRYFRRFMWMVLATVASLAAWIALDEVAGRGEADADLLNIGKWVALAAAALLALRAIFNLITYFRTRTETVRVFDRGIIWTRGKKSEFKYQWPHVKSFTEGIHRRPLFGKRGAQVLLMRDGKTLQFKPRLGDAVEYTEIVRSIVAELTAERMTRALREGKAVTVHPKLAMNKSGVIAGKNKIRWSQVDIELKRNKLVVSKLTKEGKFQSVQSYDVHTVENLYGFLDVADSAMRTHQPKRFNIKARI